MYPTEGGFPLRPRGFVPLPMPGGPVDEGIDRYAGVTPLPMPGGPVDGGIGTYQPPVAGGYQPRPRYDYDPQRALMQAYQQNMFPVQTGNLTLDPLLQAAMALHKTLPRANPAPKPPRFDFNTAQHITALLGKKRYHRRGRR